MNETFCFRLRVFSVLMSEVRRLIVMAVAAAATASLR